MKTLAVALLFVVATATMGVAQHTHSDPPPPAQPAPIKPQPTPAQAVPADPDWITFRSPEGRYSAQVPAAPQLSAQETVAGSGEKFTQYLATSTEGETVYLVGYFDFTSTMIFTPAKARDAMLANMHGTLIAEKPVTVGGSPAYEWTFACQVKGIDYLGRSRALTVGTRMYSILSLVQKVDAAASVHKIDRFFDSFALMKTPF